MSFCGANSDLEEPTQFPTRFKHLLRCNRRRSGHQQCVSLQLLGTGEKCDNDIDNKTEVLTPSKMKPQTSVLEPHKADVQQENGEAKYRPNKSHRSQHLSAGHGNDDGAGEEATGTNSRAWAEPVGYYIYMYSYLNVYIYICT